MLRGRLAVLEFVPYAIFFLSAVRCGGAETGELFANGSAGSSSGSSTGSAGKGSSGAMGGSGNTGTGQGGSSGTSVGTATGGSGGGGAGGTGIGGAGVGGQAGAAGAGPGVGGIDAGSRDGAVVRDAGADRADVIDGSSRIDSGDRPRIRCGLTSCDPNLELCCLRRIGMEACIAANSNGCPAGIPVRCDDPTDCAPGQICCADAQGSSCGSPSICFRNAITEMLCATPSQCDRGQTCSADARSVIPGYAYCHP